MVAAKGICQREGGPEHECEDDFLHNLKDGFGFGSIHEMHV